jgi:NADPH:quinone reductase-like Zn-dependent oxidoreductase
LSLFTLAWTMIRIHIAPWLRKRVTLRHVVKRCDGVQLEKIASLVEAGSIRPTLDRVMPLANVVEAHRLSETHHARGKIVLKVS